MIWLHVLSPKFVLELGPEKTHEIFEAGKGEVSKSRMLFFVPPTSNKVMEVIIALVIFGVVKL